MRHFIHTTGIADIDEQHRGIDNLISLYCKAKNHEEEERCLAALSRAVRSHFQFVENFFDVKFPTEFRQRQEQILGWLAAKIRLRLDGEIDRDELADDLRRMFVLNYPCQAEKLQAMT